MNSLKNDRISVSDFLKEYDRPAENEYIKNKFDKNQRNYIFVSFDLCNSTELKRRSIYWVDIISAFLNSHSLLTQMNCWKFNGDEILYYAEINSIFEIIDLLEEAHSFIGQAKELIVKTVQDLAKKKNDLKIDDELALLDVRGAMWISQTNDIEYKNNEISNYRFVLNKNIDFSGINIDEGFRLRNWSTMHKLIVDPKIVMILHLTDTYLNEDGFPEMTFNSLIDDFVERAKKYDSHSGYARIESVMDNFKILGYQPCKGVWDGHLYPIIWYAEDWEAAIKGLSYDEKFDGEFVVDIITNKHLPGKLGKMYQLDFLIEVLTQVRELDTVIRILNTLCFEKKKGSKSTTTRILNSSTNLYYMVVCVNPVSKNALLFKRSNHRKHLKGVWDFGNIKHISNTNSDVSMDKIIAMQYKSMFGLDIKVLGDQDRDSAPIRPLALCTVHRYGKMHNGVLCVAEILGERTDSQIKSTVLERIQETKQKFESTYQYSDVVFVNKDNIDELKLVEMDFEQIEEDSFMAELGENNNLLCGEQQFCINNCRNSIEKAINCFK